MFMVKHKFGKENKLNDVLRGREITLVKMKSETIGFEHRK
jgi:hypothetical protein